MFGRTFPRLQKELKLELPDGWSGEVIDLSLVGIRLRSVAVLKAHAVIEFSTSAAAATTERPVM